jgi:hypothetical protein
MLDFDLRAQLDFLRWIERGGLTLLPVQDHQLPRVIELMDQYADRPMDLSDATLVLAAETLDVYDIASIDRDFDVYRTANGRHLRNVFPE